MIDKLLVDFRANLKENFVDTIEETFVKTLQDNFTEITNVDTINKIEIESVTNFTAFCENKLRGQVSDLGNYMLDTGLLKPISRTEGGDVITTISMWVYKEGT